MTIETKLREYICERYGTLSNFAQKIGMGKSTISMILSRGLNKASINNIIDICQELQISVDEIANGRIVPLIQTPMYDIEAKMQELKLAASGLALDGKQLTEAEIAVIFDSVENALNCIRRLR